MATSLHFLSSFHHVIPSAMDTVRQVVAKTTEQNRWIITCLGVGGSVAVGLVALKYFANCRTQEPESRAIRVVQLDPLPVVEQPKATDFQEEEVVPPLSLNRPRASSAPLGRSFISYPKLDPGPPRSASDPLLTGREQAPDPLPNLCDPPSCPLVLPSANSEGIEEGDSQNASDESIDWRWWEEALVPWQIRALYSSAPSENPEERRDETTAQEDGETEEPESQGLWASIESGLSYFTFIG